jgi:hypothetical protein
LRSRATNDEAPVARPRAGIISCVMNPWTLELELTAPQHTPP